MHAFLYGRAQRGCAPCKQGNGHSPDTKPAGNLILDFLASRATRNKFIMCMSHIVCNILFYLTVQMTKTAEYTRFFMMNPSYNKYLWKFTLHTPTPHPVIFPSHTPYPAVIQMRLSASLWTSLHGNTWSLCLQCSSLRNPLFGLSKVLLRKPLQLSLT